MRCCTGLPCKHIASLFYMITNEVDKDPFVVMHLRGIDVAAHFAVSEAAGSAVPYPLPVAYAPQVWKLAPHRSCINHTTSTTSQTVNDALMMRAHAKHVWCMPGRSQPKSPSSWMMMMMTAWRVTAHQRPPRRRQCSCSPWTCRA